MRVIFVCHVVLICNKKRIRNYSTVKTLIVSIYNFKQRDYVWSVSKYLNFFPKWGVEIQVTFLDPLFYDEDCKKTWSSISNYFKAIKEYKRKECGTKECKFTPYLQSVIACFRVKWLPYFFVKFKTLSNVLMLVSTSFSSKT